MCTARRAILLSALFIPALRASTGYPEEAYDAAEDFVLASRRFFKGASAISPHSPDYKQQLAGLFLEYRLGDLFRDWEDAVIRG